MTSFFTAKYVPIDSGYMGQIVEWPEVVTEGSTIEECRAMLEDALREMVAAHAERGVFTSRHLMPAQHHGSLPCVAV